MPDAGELMLYIFIGLFAVVAIGAFIGIRRDAARGAEARRRQEALFQTSFPELQPYLHPEKVLAFARAWFARPYTPGDYDWERPTGFDVARARFKKVEKGLDTELLDGAGTVLARFLLQDHAEGAALRVGPGKLTVNLKNDAVRYWHPQREFKWSKTKGWRVLNALSDRGIDSDDRGMSFSGSDSSSSSSSRVAAAAAIAGAGGTFDGGGSSSSWDDSSSSGSSESRTSY